jgi:hypothetical protein
METTTSKTQAPPEQLIAYYIRTTGEYGVVRRRATSNAAVEGNEDRERG